MDIGTINYRVFLDGKEMLGTANVTLPNTNFIMQTVNGAGLGGNMEYPLKRSEFARFIIRQIGNPEIRYYKVPTFGHLNEDQAYAEVVSEWVDINSETAGDISPTIVAQGMKVALITTIFGIVVAVILQFFYNYILSKIEHLTAQMEESAITFMDSVTQFKARNNGRNG